MASALSRPVVAGPRSGRRPAPRKSRAGRQRSKPQPNIWLRWRASGNARKNRAECSPLQRGTAEISSTLFSNPGSLSWLPLAPFQFSAFPKTLIRFVPKRRFMGDQSKAKNEDMLGEETELAGRAVSRRGWLDHCRES